MTVSTRPFRRWVSWQAAAVVAVAVGLVVAGFVFWESNDRTPTPARPDCLIGGERPCSTNVEMGKAYRFQVLHCGLTWVVDFDQSFWDVDPATMTEDENGRFGINSDEGTMTLEKDDVAVYRSLRGGAATLHRHKGAKTFSVCG